MSAYSTTNYLLYGSRLSNDSMYCYTMIKYKDNDVIAGTDEEYVIRIPCTLFYGPMEEKVVRKNRDSNFYIVVEEKHDFKNYDYPVTILRIRKA